VKRVKVKDYKITFLWSCRELEGVYSNDYKIAEKWFI